MGYDRRRGHSPPYNPPMFRLSREVRFAVNAEHDPQLRETPANSYGGFPSLTAFGPYLTLQVTLEGELDPASNYLMNIKTVDAVVRQQAIPMIVSAVVAKRSPPQVISQAYDLLRPAWRGLSLEELRLAPSPFLAYSIRASEVPMVRLSQKFEFSATHRLHNPRLSDEENRRTFGKCNNPHGHGHNYELQVTFRGRPDENGLLIDVPAFERIVASAVIERFDHKNLNVELPEFRELIPTVENIARTIYGLLKPKFAGQRAQLASVTVWETPKTWCEYAEGL